jgi:hypothetical protein
MKRLPTTGTTALLERLSPYIPDDLINSLFPDRRGPGRPSCFSPAQLFRVCLLTLLTPVHSFNLMVELLAEQRSWRAFAGLRNRHKVPDVRMLHQFRGRLDLVKLRRINAHLLEPLLEGTSGFAKTVALIDATDLPAATNAYKKILPVATVLGGPPWGHAVAKMVRAAILSDTKSTHSGFGCASMNRQFFSHP